MRRLRIAALAAFLACVGGGAAHAYYFAACTFATSSNHLEYHSLARSFVAVSTGACAGGDTNCSIKIYSDLLYSLDGTYWTQLSHQEDNYTYVCNGWAKNPGQTVKIPPGTGIYKLKATLRNSDGTIIYDYGSLSQQF